MERIDEMKTHNIGRREFLVTVPAAAGVVALPCWGADEKSLVVEARREGIVKKNDRPDPTGTQEILDRAMREFTGEKSRRDQWARFVSKEDVVGLKVNGLGGPRLSTKKELLQAIIQGLLDAGVKENNIIVWDGRERHIRAVGCPVNLGDSGVRVYSSDRSEIGYDREETRFESGSTRLSKILTEQITASINVPIMKDHRIAGTTLALKNISHGVIHNPNEFHGNGCDPSIGQINAIPAVRAKHRLVVLDALQGCFARGPRHSPDGTYNYESLYITTDPVAIDTIGTERIEAVRKEKGLPSLAEANTPAKYLLTAEKLGLGNHAKDRIDHRTIAG